MHNDVIHSIIIALLLTFTLIVAGVSIMVMLGFSLLPAIVVGGICGFVVGVWLFFTASGY